MDIYEKLKANINDRRVVKAFLSDYYMENRQKINAMMFAYDMNIVPEVLSGENKHKGISIIKKMISEYGIIESVAKDAVNEWIKIFGKTGITEDEIMLSGRIGKFYFYDGKYIHKCSTRTNKCLQLFKDMNTGGWFVHQLMILTGGRCRYFDEDEFCNRIETIACRNVVGVDSIDKENKLIFGNYYGLLDYKMLSYVELADKLIEEFEVYNATMEMPESEKEEFAKNKLKEALKVFGDEQVCSFVFDSFEPPELRYTNCMDFVGGIKADIVRRLMNDDDVNGLNYLSDNICIFEDVERNFCNVNTSPIKRIKIKIKNDYYVEDVMGCSYEEIADRIYSRIQDTEDTILQLFPDGLISVLMGMGYFYYSDIKNDVLSIECMLDTINERHAQIFRLTLSEERFILFDFSEENTDVIDEFIERDLSDSEIDKLNDTYGKEIKFSGGVEKTSIIKRYPKEIIEREFKKKIRSMNKLFLIYNDLKLVDNDLSKDQKCSVDDEELVCDENVELIYPFRKKIEIIKVSGKCCPICGKKYITTSNLDEVLEHKYKAVFKK